MQNVLAILASLLAVASASPFQLLDRDPDPTPLEKRDKEIVYLANCKHVVSCCPPLATTYSSAILYYPTTAAGNSGQYPGNNNICTTSSNGYRTWEGQRVSCTFPSGVTYTSNIDAGAQGRANFAYAGTGNNGKGWNCYKDNQRIIYQDNPPEAHYECDSIYYCIPN